MQNSLPTEEGGHNRLKTKSKYTKRDSRVAIAMETQSLKTEFYFLLFKSKNKKSFFSYFEH